MQAIAPNLTALVGELVGARLIAHAGTLINLAKAPASTVQILGAEKALFRALKTKHATPKYGLLFHASLIGQASPKNKGKVARVLAAKCSLAIRCDALGEGGDAQVGVDARGKVRPATQQAHLLECNPLLSAMDGAGRFDRLAYMRCAEYSAGILGIKDDKSLSQFPMTTDELWYSNCRDPALSSHLK